MLIFYIFSFLLGLGVGSFLNVVILRGSRGESFIRGRSYCESCKKNLSWFELIPLVSFILQKGRCRSCRFRLSWQYPVVELLTGIAFALAFNLWTSDVHKLVTGCIIIAAAIVIFVSDIRWQIIPNGAVLTLLAAAAFREFTRSDLVNIWYDVAAALGVALFFCALWFLSRGRWMGFGDVKLIFAVSLLLGFPASILAALFSFWIGAIIGIILLALRLADLKTQIPFGPFILAGSVSAYFYTKDFLWYFGL